jgi:ribosomal-protein-alanine N-acetyltransferase
MKFRPYRESDLEAMFALDIVCFERPFRFGLEDIRRFAAEPDAVTVVAEGEDGELIGFFIVELNDDAAYLVTLDVSPSHRRRGVGRELLARAENAFAGAERMVLHVHVGNEAAIRFYEANGYRRTGEAKSFYGRGIDAWIYTKPIELAKA